MEITANIDIVFSLFEYGGECETTDGRCNDRISLDVDGMDGSLSELGCEKLESQC
jgi:hypothetical protein